MDEMQTAFLPTEIRTIGPRSPTPKTINIDLDFEVTAVDSRIIQVV